MRIGFDAKRAFVNTTGLGNYSRFVLDSLQLYGAGQAYLAYTPKNDRNLFPGFPPHSVIKPESSFDKKLSAYWRYSSITNQLLADRIGLFHGLSNEIPLGLVKAKIASVVSIHDLIFEKLPTQYKAIDRAIYRHKFKFACEKSDSIVAISAQTKRDIVALYHIEPTKIEVIYQDCNPIFKTKVDADVQFEIRKIYGLSGPFVLSVGTIEERKNQLLLTQAFGQLHNRDFKLVLVGRATPYVKKIRDYIRRNRLTNRVTILENVPTTHLPALYQAAEVFAYISVYEGFGIPIVEALHSGTPVLAAKGSCLEEAGGPGGLYANPTEIDSVSYELEKLLGDTGLRNALVDKGKTHVERFAAPHIASQLVALYNRVGIQYR